MAYNLTFFYILVTGLFPIWNIVHSQPEIINDPTMVVMWKVNASTSDLSIIPFRQHKDQFRPENALLIWKGYFYEDVDSKPYLYYWLGEDVEPNVAILTADLAVRKALQTCHNRPVFHREVQGYESETFTSYFEDVHWENIRYNEEHSNQRLYYVRGNDNPHIKQVSVEAEWLGKGGCLVLYATNIFVRCDETAGSEEITMARKLARTLYIDTGEQAEIHNFMPDDSNRESCTPKATENFRVFLSELGKSRKTYRYTFSRKKFSRTSSKEFEKIRDKEISITMIQSYIERDTGKLVVKMKNVKLGRPFKMASLDSEVCLVLDSVSEISGIFIWLGRNSTDSSQIEAARIAEQTLVDKNYARKTPITVVEEIEKPPLAFRINFIDGL